MLWLSHTGQREAFIKMEENRKKRTYTSAPVKTSYAFVWPLRLLVRSPFPKGCLGSLFGWQPPAAAPWICHSTRAWAELPMGLFFVNFLNLNSRCFNTQSNQCWKVIFWQIWKSTSCSCSQGEGLCQHHLHQLCSEHWCQQHKCWHVSISMSYPTSKNVCSLIRPKIGSGLLITGPGSNGIPRGHSCPPWRII